MWPKLRSQPKWSPDLLSLEGMRVTWSQGTLGMEVMKQRRYLFLYSFKMLWASASLLHHMQILDITFCPHVPSATWRDWPSRSVDSSQLFYLMIPPHFLQRFILQRNPYSKIGGGGKINTYTYHMDLKQLPRAGPWRQLCPTKRVTCQIEPLVSSPSAILFPFKACPGGGSGYVLLGPDSCVIG